jgi:hypothetical protein
VREQGHHHGCRRLAAEAWPREVLEEFRSTTSTVAIVAMDLESDPVGSSMVVRLAQPGGNITILATASATKVKSEPEGVRNART